MPTQPSSFVQRIKDRLAKREERLKSANASPKRQDMPERSNPTTSGGQTTYADSYQSSAPCSSSSSSSSSFSCGGGGGE